MYNIGLVLKHYIKIYNYNTLLQQIQYTNIDSNASSLKNMKSTFLAFWAGTLFTKSFCAGLVLRWLSLSSPDGWVSESSYKQKL